MEKRITRTVNYKELRVMFVNVAEKSVFENTVEYTGRNVSTDKILTELNKGLDATKQQAVAILEVTEKEQLYAMTEADFIKYATPIDSRFAKIE